MQRRAMIHAINRQRPPKTLVEALAAGYEFYDEGFGGYLVRPIVSAVDLENSIEGSPRTHAFIKLRDR